MKFKDLFDPKCRAEALRYWSNWLAVLTATAAAWAVDNQATILGWINHIEQPYRSALTFIVTAAVPIMVRMMRQPNLPDDPVEGE